MFLSGQRIISMTDLKENPLIDSKQYSVGTIDFVTTGGDVFSIFQTLPIKNTEINLRDTLVAQMKKQQSSDEGENNRLTVTNQYFKPSCYRELK